MRTTSIDNDFRAKQRRQVALRRLSPLLTILLLLLLWQWITHQRIISPILVPAPADVYAAFADALADGSLAKHTMTTLGEMMYGLVLGVGIGLVLGYAIAKAPLLEYVLSPIIVAFQSTPIVAYAPLLIIWFGTGPSSKVVTTAVIVFFPTLVNAIVGIRSVSPRLRDLMRSLNAGPWRTFRALELPSALPVILAGLKTSATLAVIGAVVGEFVGSGSGLGVLVIMARSQYNTPLVVVTVLTMTVIALSLYSLVAFVEWRFLVWQRRAAS
ncbi:MAG: ABC transporter permease [Chloroflexi bacterium]|nr:ABC transporter permease [Chloroflexota bacterium]